MDLKHPILDEIIKTVDTRGSHEISFKVLEEDVFSQEHSPRRSARELLLIWAVENQIHYDYKNNGDGAIVYFYRKNRMD
jgi:hypothetical protein